MNNNNYYHTESNSYLFKLSPWLRLHVCLLIMNSWMNTCNVTKLIGFINFIILHSQLILDLLHLHPVGSLVAKCMALLIDGGTTKKLLSAYYKRLLHAPLSASSCMSVTTALPNGAHSYGIIIIIIIVTCILCKPWIHILVTYLCCPITSWSGSPDP